MDYEGNPALLLYKLAKEAGMSPNPEKAIEDALYCEVPVEVRDGQLTIPPMEIESVHPVEDPEWPSVIGEG